MKEILCILKSTKRDIDIFKLYDSIEGVETTFFFDINFVKIKNSKENYEILKNSRNVFFYDNNRLPKLNKKIFDFIFVFGLNKQQIKITFKYLSKNTKLVWKSLGGDIYNPSFVKQEEIYQPETYKLLKSVGGLRQNIRSIIPLVIKKYSFTQRFFSAIDFVSPMLESEMEIIKRNKNIKAEYVFIPLGDNHVTKNTKVIKVSDKAKNIYVGSSASPVANHLDVFKKISSIDFKNNIYVTLSYKKDKDYQEKILEKGFDILGKQFIPQTEFYSKDQFNKVLNSCSIAIFNNDRQEGLFSIELCLLKGMKVFLAESGFIYKYLKQMGYNVFSFQSEFTLEMINSKEISYPIDLNKKSIFEIDEKQAVYDALSYMNQ